MQCIFLFFFRCIEDNTFSVYKYTFPFIKYMHCKSAGANNFHYIIFSPYRRYSDFPSYRLSNWLYFNKKGI